MRHLKHTAKLGRKSEHRNPMLANLVCSLIQHRRITTTLAKAKAARPVAEKIVTLGKSGTLHARRLAAAKLKYNPRHQLPTKEQVKKARENDVLRILFEEIAPGFKDRPGGYTRIVKLHQRQGDAAEMAILEWVEATAVAGAASAPAAPATEAAPASQPAEESKPEQPAK